MSNLKEKFDRAYDAIHQPMPSLDAYINDLGSGHNELEIPLESVTMPETVALGMMNDGITYWEHYGWGKACFSAIYGLASAGLYPSAENLAKWLVKSFPKGAESLSYKTQVEQFADGIFPVEEFERRAEIYKILKSKTKRLETAVFA